jgi:hypothetical protein
MKKLLLSALLLSVGMVSCKKDESVPTRSLTTDELPLVGTWRATKYVRKGYGSANDSAFYKIDPPILTFQETGFYQYSEGDFNNHTGFLPTTGQDFPGLFEYTPSILSITHIEEYNYKQRRNTVPYDLTWIGADKRQFTLKLRGQSVSLIMTFVK